MRRIPNARRITRSVHIPGFWTGHEALAVVAFLESIIIEIWGAHGDEMIATYGKAKSLTNYADVPPRFRQDDDEDEEEREIPF